MKQPYITFAFLLILALSIGIVLSDETSAWWFLGVAVGFYGSIISIMHYFRRDEHK